MKTTTWKAREAAETTWALQRDLPPVRTFDVFFTAGWHTAQGFATEVQPVGTIFIFVEKSSGLMIRFFLGNMVHTGSRHQGELGVLVTVPGSEGMQGDFAAHGP